MSDERRLHNPQKNVALQGRIDRLCDRFEAEWRAGGAPSIDDMLAGWDEPERSQAKAELEAVLSELARGERETFSTRGIESVAGQRSGSASFLPEHFGRYQILRPLGSGGMGEVYLAEDSQLQRKIALKVPRFASPDQEQMSRFYREARAAAALHHPNICPVHDIGDIDGQHYISMAYIEGQSLRESIKSGHRFSDHEIAAMTCKLARALEEAHAAGIVHRDLKPANIMIDRRGEPIIMDFGLARRATSDETWQTQSGTILGTPAYMPPEQIEGDTARIGPTSDIYSLGVIVYELVSGAPPFAGPPTKVMTDILIKDAPSLADKCPHANPDLIAICKKMMAKQPQDRYRSMGEVVAALEHVALPSAAASSVTQPLAAAPQRKASPASARRRRMVLALTAAAALVGLIALSLWGPGRRQPPPGTSASDSAMGASGSLSARGTDTGGPAASGTALPGVATAEDELLRSYPNRAVALRVLKRDGSVNLEYTDSDRRFHGYFACNSISELPQEPFSVLALTSHSATDDDLEGIEHLEKLRDIDLIGSGITDVTLERVGKLNHCIGIRLNGTKVSDAGLARLRKLVALRLIDLTGTTITDEGLSHLTNLTNLHHLHLGGTSITDDGLQHLSGLANLQQVVLDNTQITGDGLRHLSGLSNIEWIGLWRSMATGVALDHLSPLPNLTYVNIAGTRIQPDDLWKLKFFPKLDRVSIDGSQLSGDSAQALAEVPTLATLGIGHGELKEPEALEHLTNISFLAFFYVRCPKEQILIHIKPLENLKTLDLQENGQLTDADLERLAEMQNLEHLYLQRCNQLTREGVARLKAALPDCEIVSDFGTF